MNKCDDDDSRETKEPRVRWRCVSAPHGEYDKLTSAAATLRAVATNTFATDLIVVCT